MDIVTETRQLLDAATPGPWEEGDYYARICAAGPEVVEVKLADIDDNTDPARLDRLKRWEPETHARLVEKYAKARQALGVGGDR